MAKKQNRFAHKAQKTRRINGREVHAARGELLKGDLEVIREHLKRFPNADEEFFEIACKGNPCLSGVLKLVRAGALNNFRTNDQMASHT